MEQRGYMISFRKQRDLGYANYTLESGRSQGLLELECPVRKHWNCQHLFDKNLNQDHDVSSKLWCLGVCA